MRVTTDFNGPTFELRLVLDQGEVLDGVGQGGMQVRLTADSARIRLPGVVAPHPDLIALATLTIVRPWVGHRLELSQPVSKGFAEATREHLGFELGPVDVGLQARRRGSRTGLLFSGGPDSLVSEMLLGGPLPSFHVKRVRHPAIPNRATHLRSDVQERVVRDFEDRGRELWVAETDLEFMCTPFPTFPQNVSLAAPLVLLADDADLGACAHGNDFSDVYLLSGRRFVPGRRSQWKAVMEAAGVTLVQATAGATAVASTRLASRHHEFESVRSCLLGTDTGPCLRCEKCLRRGLVRAFLGIEELDPALITRTAANKRLVDSLSTARLYAEHVYSFLLGRMPELEATFLAETMDRLRRPAEETAWVERWYPSALEDWMPRPRHKPATELIEAYVGFMTPDEVAAAEAWKNVDYDGTGEEVVD